MFGLSAAADFLMLDGNMYISSFAFSARSSGDSGSPLEMPDDATAVSSSSLGSFGRREKGGGGLGGNPWGALRGSGRSLSIGP